MISRSKSSKKNMAKNQREMAFPADAHALYDTIGVTLSCLYKPVHAKRLYRPN